MEAISAAEYRFIADGAAQDFRNDGRSRSKFRPFSIETGVIPQANGSARLLLGATHILACVKAEIGSPLPDRPGAGRIEVAVDCSPTATPAFRGRGGEELAAELASSLERSFCGGRDGSGAAVDLSQLVIEGKACWVLSLEVLLLNMDGNLLDATALALKAALCDCVLPRVEVVMGEGGAEEEPTLEIVDEGDANRPVDTSGMPLIVTITRVGKHNIVDATPEEEAVASANLSVAIRPGGTVTCISKGGREGIHPSVLLEMLAEARVKAAQLHETVEAQLQQLKEAAE